MRESGHRILDCRGGQQHGARTGAEPPAKKKRALEKGELQDSGWVLDRTGGGPLFARKLSWLLYDRALNATRQALGEKPAHVFYVDSHNVAAWCNGRAKIES